MRTLSDYVGSGFCEMTTEDGPRPHYGPLVARFDEFHVKIGHGRDYDDVTPLRGVYYGESDHHLAAEVTMSTSRIVNDSVPQISPSQAALLLQQ